MRESGQATLIGMGVGWESVTREAESALRRADAILGSARILKEPPDFCTKLRVPETKAETLLRLLLENPWENPCVLYGGDAGFHSGARLLIPLLQAAGIPYRVVSGVSSVQLLSARLGRPWEDWNLCSAHGVDCDAVAAVSRGKAAFFLTGTNQRESPSALCGQLAAAGLGNLSVMIGENLGGPDEQITRCSASEASERRFSPLSVLLVEAATTPYPQRASGIPDADFIRGRVPMTKQEVRTVILAKLAVRPADTVWDVGAGTGSVSAELSRTAYRGRIFAVERDADACELIRRNREKFGAWNLTLISGDAPESLQSLPAPDAVFIGGSGGHLKEIIAAILEKNPQARLCVSAIALETLSDAVTAFAAHGLDAEICQISVSRARAVGNLHLLTAQNPVFLISSQIGNGGASEIRDGDASETQDVPSGIKDAASKVGDAV